MARVLALAHHPCRSGPQTREWRTTRLLARLVRLTSDRRSCRSRRLFIARSASSSSSRSSARAVRSSAPARSVSAVASARRNSATGSGENRTCVNTSATPAPTRASTSRWGPAVGHGDGEDGTGGCLCNHDQVLKDRLDLFHHRGFEECPAEDRTELPRLVVTQLYRRGLVGI